ncbi:hypothetical protein [Variovorax sp.]|uniref:hypothetical protein n=1 Tax=Variovorax sp. TaxID=1871043 RepID=UPI003BAB7B80
MTTGEFFYAYASFYPQELDFIIQLNVRDEGGCLVVLETMSQEGQGDEEIFNFIGDELLVEKELSVRRSEVI